MTGSKDNPAGDQLTIDKSALLQTIVDDLQATIRAALAAADEARQTATNKENAAENKYDTLGLEAAYLAHGQSERVMQLGEALAAFQNLASNLSRHDEVSLGSLVWLEDESGSDRMVFIGPAAGGQMVDFAGQQILVVTQQSPLGLALQGAACSDEVTAEIGGRVVTYLVTALC